MLDFSNQRVAVFIDTQNLYYSGRNLFGKKVNFGSVVSEALGNRQLIRATAYVVSTEGGDESPFFEALQKAGIQTKSKPLMEYFSGTKKADWDVGIAVDAMSVVDLVDVVILASGDGDFVPLAQYVRSQGRRFEVISFRETTASTLLEWTDAYTNISDNKSAFLIGKSRQPAVHMTKGGEALVEQDQVESLPTNMPKKRTLKPLKLKLHNKTTAPSKGESEPEEPRARRLSF